MRFATERLLAALCSKPNSLLNPLFSNQWLTYETESLRIICPYENLSPVYAGAGIKPEKGP